MKPRMLALAAAVAFLSTAAFAKEAKLSAVDADFKGVTVDGKKIAVSGKRTKITIGGKSAEREQLKAGMSCTIESKDAEATKIDCK